MTMADDMKIYTPRANGDLDLQKGSSIIVTFGNGKTLELTASPRPLPPGIPDGIYVWGGRVPSDTSTNTPTSRLDITPVAANGIVVSPHTDNHSRTDAITISIADDKGSMTSVDSNKVVLALSNGKTVEVMEDYAHKGLLIWGGREPDPALPLEEMKQRTESLGLYFLAANVAHLFPYKFT